MDSRSYQLTCVATTAIFTCSAGITRDLYVIKKAIPTVFPANQLDIKALVLVVLIKLDTNQRRKYGIQ